MFHIMKMNKIDYLKFDFIFLFYLSIGLAFYGTISNSVSLIFCVKMYL